MAARGPYRAVSLDLWFTILSYPAEFDRHWQTARVSYLRTALIGPEGRALELAEIETAVGTVDARLKAAGRGVGIAPPERLLTEYARALQSDLRIPLSQAAEQYSSIGLDDHPPVVNPEAYRLMEGLRARQIPILLLTNTARRASTWDRFFRERVGLPIDHIVASCDAGHAKPDPEIFRVAAERLGLPPGQILHVGDRTELDVEGALASGFGAALYRGLWGRYPAGLYPPTAPHWLRHPDVIHLERLDELLTHPLLGEGRSDSRDRR